MIISHPILPEPLWHRQCPNGSPYPGSFEGHNQPRLWQDHHCPRRDTPRPGQFGYPPHKVDSLRLGHTQGLQFRSLDAAAGSFMLRAYHLPRPSRASISTACRICCGRYPEPGCSSPWPYPAARHLQIDLPGLVASLISSADDVFRRSRGRLRIIMRA